LTEAVLRMGRLSVANLSKTVNIHSSISLSERKVMGVSLPVVKTEFVEHSPFYSPMDTTFWVDTALVNFKKALGMMGHLAELKVSIMRLAMEVKKTIRKVNALEKIAIPEYKAAVHLIQNRLEESERDMFVLMKMVKANLEKKKNRGRE
jgi:V/A-type H+-transporting ATPase subunit D